MSKAVIRQTRFFFPLNSIIFLLLLILTIPLLLFINQRIQDVRQHAAGVTCNNTGVTQKSDGTYSFALLHVSTTGNIVDQNNCVIQFVGLNQGWFASDAPSGPTAQMLTAWHQVMPYIAT